MYQRLDQDGRVLEQLSEDDAMFAVHVETNQDERDDSVLTEAYRLTRGDRNDDYGHPLDDFAKTGKMWSGIVGVEVTPEMVAMMMVCVKISRQLNKPQRDNLVDACGYMSTIEMIEQERERRTKHNG